jgi:hypothetical protein
MTNSFDGSLNIIKVNHPPAPLLIINYSLSITLSPFQPLGVEGILYDGVGIGQGSKHDR